VTIESVAASMSTHTLFVGAQGTASCKLLDDPQPLDMSGYSETCSQPSDCHIVTNQPCVTCTCPTAVVGNVDAQKFQSDLRERASSCDWTQTNMGCGVDCAAPIVSCENGSCVVGR
jgi:hypothetical protein